MVSAIPAVWAGGPALSSRLGGRVMKLAVRVLSVCCLTVLLGAAPAQDKKPQKPKGDPISAAFAMPKKITLDEKQQAKLEALKKEYTPRLKELHEKLDKILTPEKVK